MKKLLFVSIPFIMIACGTSEDSVQSEEGENNTKGDSVVIVPDSLSIDLPLSDSANPIIHGTPDPEKLDSLKKSKKNKKK